MVKGVKHNPLELSEALEHVIYEIWKYKQSIQYYTDIKTAGSDAAIEFRVLHQRVLLEFFYGPPKHANNIVAWEYIDDWQRTHSRTNLSWLDDYMTRCHTMLAHISTQRSKIAKQRRKDWSVDWQVVEPHIDQTITEFLSCLAPEHKEVCRQWVVKWGKIRCIGNEILAEIGVLLG